MIEVNNLVKTYDQVRALDGVSFSIKKGEIIGFLGPNGAGKTTTMRIITGYLRPDGGNAVVAGYDVASYPIEVKRRIGYLPEDNPLYMDMQVREYLEFIGEARGLESSELREAMGRVSEIAGISGVLKRPIGELSKGYRQRVGLAQALLHDPDILILDEPTSGLDPSQIVEIRGLIKDLGREKTVVVSTHILPEVSATSSRVIIINKGRIVAEGTIEELERKAEKGETLYAVFKDGRADLERELTSLDFIEDFQLVSVDGDEFKFAIRPKGAEDIREKLFDFAVEHNFKLLEIWRERATLEEVFLQLTTEE